LTPGGQQESKEAKREGQASPANPPCHCPEIIYERLFGLEDCSHGMFCSGLFVTSAGATVTAIRNGAAVVDIRDTKSTLTTCASGRGVSQVL
jgi:hypothetical protein